MTIELLQQLQECVPAVAEQLNLTVSQIRELLSQQSTLLAQAVDEVQTETREVTELTPEEKENILTAFVALCIMALGLGWFTIWATGGFRIDGKSPLDIDDDKSDPYL